MVINTRECTYYVTMEKTLEYYFDDGTHVIFDKYTIDTTGGIKNKNTREMVKTYKTGKYNACSVYYDPGKKRGIQIGRALASTFYGPPTSSKHTADHIDRNPNNDAIDNIRWLCKSGQRNNQEQPKTLNLSFIVIKDNVEKTAKEWVEQLRDQKNHMGRDYTECMIREYAQRKQHGFAYKKYPDLQGEVWKEINGSKSKRGRWKISDMNRVKYVTNHAEHLLSGERLGLDNSGYPFIKIDKKQWRCHILSFMTFFPNEYKHKKQNEIILHEDDNKLDFRPHKLHLGTRQENAIQAHVNGCHNNTKTERLKCASYINGVLETEHESQHDAMRYLKSIGMKKASQSEISRALKEFTNGEVIMRYGRTWKLVV